MTEPQPSKAHFDMTQPKPILGFTNHVRVHAAHDREHDCYISFTLQRLYMFPMSHDYGWKVEYSMYRRPPLHTSEVCARQSLQGCSIVSSSL
jgi:hypothetical protein